MNETIQPPTMRATPPDWAYIFHDEARFWILTVLTPIVVTIGVLGNAVTIIVLTRKRMKSTTNIYLTALAVVDIFFLLLNLQLSFWHHPALKTPEFLPLWKTWGTVLWLTDALCGMSTWMTVSFTLERYIAVCHPLRGKVMCTESRAKKVILWVIILSLLITSPTPFEWSARIRKDSKGNTISEVYQNSLSQSQTYKSIFHNLWGILFMFIPFLILLILNSLLIMAVRKSQRRRSGLTEDTRGMGGSIRANSVLKRESKLLKKNKDDDLLDDETGRKSKISRRGYKERQENKITIALVSVVCLFLVCQAPSTILLTVDIFYSPMPKTTGFHIVRGLSNISNFLVLINAMANFLLYCAMSDKYRQTLAMTFCPSHFKHKRTSTFTSVASFRNSTA